MSAERARPLRANETALIAAMLASKREAQSLQLELATALVEEMNDGGMGSLRFVGPPGRKFGEQVAEAEFQDEDGVALSITARKSVRRLLILIAMMVVGYACIEMLRLTASLGNLILVWVYLIVPFFAIQPVRRLSQPFKALGFVILIPVLLLSVVNLSVSILDALVPALKRTEPLQTVQQGHSSVQLGRYEHGGAVGVRGVYLEQRRPVLPGLYLVRSIDAFGYAHEATLSVDGPYRVRVHAIGSYNDAHLVVDRVYSLKSWVYF